MSHCHDRIDEAWRWALRYGGWTTHMTEDVGDDLQSWSAFAAGIRAKIVQGSIWIEPPGNDIPLDLQVGLHDLDPARERERIYEKHHEWIPLHLLMETGKVEARCLITLTWPCWTCRGARLNHWDRWWRWRRRLAPAKGTKKAIRQVHPCTSWMPAWASGRCPPTALRCAGRCPRWPGSPSRRGQPRLVWFPGNEGRRHSRIIYYLSRRKGWKKNTSRDSWFSHMNMFERRENSIFTSSKKATRNKFISFICEQRVEE